MYTLRVHFLLKYNVYSYYLALSKPVDERLYTYWQKVDFTTKHFLGTVRAKTELKNHLQKTQFSKIVMFTYSTFNNSSYLSIYFVRVIFLGFKLIEIEDVLNSSN